MSISQKYRSYGLRRLFNLSDIEDPESALNNILNELQVETGKSFISQDLDVIRGIKDANVDSSTFFQLASTAETYTFANTSGIFEDFVSPLITLKDKINTYRSVTGEPGAISSGMGPTAWFVPSSSVNNNITTTLSLNSIIPNFNTSKTNLIKNDDFWSLGEFYLEDKFDDNFPDENGGIAWEGYFSPGSLYTSPQASFVTTGLFHVEIDKFKNGNWETLKSIYKPVRQVILNFGATNETVLNLNPGYSKTLAIGDKLESNTNITITAINGDNITLSAPVSYGEGDYVNFKFDVGTDEISGSYAFDKLYDVGDHVPIRIFWWYPSNTEGARKYLRNVYLNSSIMTYNNFSNTDVTSPSEYEIRRLIDNAVTDYQENHGSVSYKKFRTTNTFKSSYIPPKSFSDINMRGGNTSVGITFTQGTRYFDTTYTAIANTTSGNYVIDSALNSFSRIPKGMRIKQEYGSVGETGTRNVTIPFLASGSSIASKIINHNGLIDYFLARSSGNVVTIQGDTSANIRKGMICISNFSGSSTYNTITAISNTTSFTTSGPLNLGSTSNNYVFVYADSGILDLSKDIYCTGVIGKLVTSTVPSGNNRITVASNTSLSYGMKVQYSGAIEPSANVVISAISGNTVILSSLTTGQIKANMTVVFAPSNTTTDKQSCILPLDLSPPFLGISDGLDTVGKNIVSSNSQLAVVALSLNANNTLISSANSSMSFDTKIKLNTTYRIKAVKV